MPSAEDVQALPAGTKTVIDTYTIYDGYTLSKISFKKRRAGETSKARLSAFMLKIEEPTS